MDKAIYVAEFYRISHGVGVLDRMLKRARVSLLYADPVCIGKYLTVLGGDVEAVREASQEVEGSEAVQSFLDGAYLLTSAHPDILRYFDKEKQAEAPGPLPPVEALGLFETTNAASGFISMDAALKAGQVALRRIWLGHFLGGKLCYVLEGTVSDVEAALAAAENAVTLPDRGKVAGSQLIPYPDEAVRQMFMRPRP